MVSGQRRVVGPLTTNHYYFFFFGSTWPPALTHASHPPFKARARLKPFARNICAARALVCSLGQVQ